MTDNDKAVSQRHGRTHSALTPLEWFGLATGIIGLIADVLALVTFAMGLQNLTNPPNTHLYVLLITLSPFLLIYGTFVVSWVLARRQLMHFPAQRRKAAIEETVSQTIVATAILSAPLWAAWYIATWVFIGKLSGSDGQSTVTGAIASLVLAIPLFLGILAMLETGLVNLLKVLL